MSEGFQFIDIIFFAMIAAFLVLRLRGVLGRRDGHQGKTHNPFKNRPSEQQDNNIIAMPDRTDPYADESPLKESALDAGESDDPMVRGLMEIQRANPDFDSEDFISGSKIAFELILGAYASGDTGTLKPLLSPEVLANFSRAIRDREQAGETLEDTLVGIKSADIVEAYLEGRMVNITIKFFSDQINATRDENGDVVDGNPNAVIEVTDFWTFARDTKSRNPNWTLIATSSLD
ncbi:MAG: translocase [Rhodospirillaceae bacterium]|nr:translocase [Rhodospirillaceae bacterium]|tara:strand:- start:230 stop:928 length:699 start_codon:yes stop_codon:yes gene_type:complete